jgi:hypothetical protein
MSDIKKLETPELADVLKKLTREFNEVLRELTSRNGVLVEYFVSGGLYSSVTQQLYQEQPPQDNTNGGGEMAVLGGDDLALAE